jgi:hypothetical protein
MLTALMAVTTLWKIGLNRQFVVFDSRPSCPVNSTATVLVPATALRCAENL